MDSNKNNDEKLNKFFDDPKIARLRDLLISQINYKNTSDRNRKITNPVIKQNIERYNPIVITVNDQVYKGREIFTILENYNYVEKQFILKKIIEDEYKVDLESFTIELLREKTSKLTGMQYYY